VTQASKSKSARESQLRALRIRQGLSQAELAERAGMHRNSIRKIEDGTTHEVTAENAEALAAALKTKASQLGVRVRASAEQAHSIRIRRLTAEQRQIVAELLTLPPEDYGLLRTAIERLRKKHEQSASVGAEE